MNSSVNAELKNTISLQQAASNPRNSAWVFASAGSGKTKVLTDRVLRLLLEGVKPHKILCLTFTKIAAAEMQERINNRLGAWVVMDEEKLLQEISDIQGRAPNENELKKARILFATVLDEASQIKIQTIHAFCQNLVKIFPFENNVRPDFEVSDTNIEKLLLARAKKQVLEDALHDKKLRDAISKINVKISDDSFNELMTKILSQKEKLIFLQEEFLGLENVIKEIAKNFAVDLSENEENIFAQFLQKINADDLWSMIEELASSQQKTNQKTAFLLKKFLQNSSLENLSIFKEIFFTQKNEPKKPGSVVTKEFAHYHEIILIQQNLIAEFLEKLNSQKIVEATSLLLQFIDNILKKYVELKAQNSLLDYNDLIIRCERMLKNPDCAEWIKFRMDGFFDHILVDESQDTNHRQWAVIKALTEDFFVGLSAGNQNRSIFIIGDDKQSIYSFQGAEPNISSEIFSYYQQKLQGGPFKLNKIDLQNSFRSRAIILSAVDAVFLNQNYMGSLEYRPHKPIRQGIGKVEIWPQIKATKQENVADFEWKILKRQEEDYAEKEFVAEMIAKKIFSWVKSGRAIEGRNEVIKYGDIMILLRNRANDFDKILQKYFSQYGIPFKGAKKTSFLQELLIQDLLAAAKFALLPQDDLNLAAFLKSPLIGLSEEDLFEVARIKNEKEISLFEALKSSFASESQKLQTLIEDAQNLNCFEFFSKLLSTDIQKNIIAEFGDEALQMLDQFLIIVANFCYENSYNLQKFLEFVEKLDPEISLISSAKNQVMITTIHSAKGLQAPIVIIPDCCFSFNRSKAAKENFFWMNFGKVELPVWCPRKNEENELVKIWRNHKNQLTQEEYFRLLYVAMTRAEDELYLTGFGASNDEKSWYEIVKNSFKEMALELDFIASLSDDEKRFFEKKLEKFIIEDKMLRL